MKANLTNQISYLLPLPMPIEEQSLYVDWEIISLV